MDAKLVHPENAPYPISLTPWGRVTVVRLLQLENMSSSITSTPSGMTTEFRLQHWNACIPMEVTLLGISIVVSFLHWENAWLSIVLNVWGRVIEVKLSQLEKAEDSIFVNPSGSITVARELHTLKVYALIVVTPLGMVTELRLWQPANAFVPILLKLSGRTIEENGQLINASLPIASRLLDNVTDSNLWQHQNA